MIKIIIFDIGNVIVDFNLRLVSRYIADLTSYPEEDIHTFMFKGDLDRALDRGYITPEKFYAAVQKQFSLTVSYRDFSDVFCNIFTAKPEMDELIRKLKENRYRLAVLSNTNRLHFDFLLEKFPVMRCFDDYHTSFMLRALKPDPKIYRKVLDYYDCPGNSIFYTDDIEDNVTSAKTAGLRTAHFNSFDSLIRMFQELDIKYL